MAYRMKISSQLIMHDSHRSGYGKAGTMKRHEFSTENLCLWRRAQRLRVDQLAKKTKTAKTNQTHASRTISFERRLPILCNSLPSLFSKPAPITLLQSITHMVCARVRTSKSAPKLAIQFGKLVLAARVTQQQAGLEGHKKIYAHT